MKSTRRPLVELPTKVPTGIAGFDEITRGGLPRGRTTLLLGGPGSGKTVFGLQFLEHGAQARQEPGIFVAFEEASKRIVANAESFGWHLGKLQRQKVLFLLDAQPIPDLVLSGDFDLCGMLAALEAQIKQMKAQRIVFDALDVLLALLPDQAARRREIYRLHAWLMAQDLTGIITAKSGGDESDSVIQHHFNFIQFMVDCSVILSHRVLLGVSHRNLRVQKYRGSNFDENESPFLIGRSGLEVAVARMSDRVPIKVNHDRVSSGVERLDTMLNGGFYRSAIVLITGVSGTAKTTLGGAFAEAACRRGERTLFVSFDSDSSEVVRNLNSVNIRLAPYVKSKTLCMTSARSISGSAETYLVHIKGLVKEHGATCLVIDPVSGWYKSDNDSTAQSAVDRLIDWCKGTGVTLVCTSLLDEMSNRVVNGSSLQLSALADTWIHLSYLMQAGERNRGLSIVKSRGTVHSNQMRELILSEKGVTLADTYSAGGEVLMGTLRWEKERLERVLGETAEVTAKLNAVRLAAEEAVLEVRMKSLQTELMAKQTEKALLVHSTQTSEGEVSRGISQMQEMRGADAATAGKNGSQT